MMSQQQQQHTVSDGATNTTNTSSDEPKVPLYLAEGIFSVEKPSNWTSSDVVSYIRGILERVSCEEKMF